MLVMHYRPSSRALAAAAFLCARRFADLDNVALTDSVAGAGSGFDGT